MTRNHWRYGASRDKAPLHYPECGLDDVYLVSGYEVEKTPYGRGVSVHNVDGLLRAIGQKLATEKKVLNGKELRFLRKQMDLTQAELGRVIGLGAQQVARWEKGEYEIPGPAERLVRLLFIQHIGGDLDLRALLQSIEEHDEAPGEALVFAKTPRGWKPAAAA